MHVYITYNSITEKYDIFDMSDNAFVDGGFFSMQDASNYCDAKKYIIH